MQPLTGIERIGNILKHKPVDRIGLFEHFWPDTQKKWEGNGLVAKGANYADEFGLDMDLCWPLDLMIRPNFVQQVVEESEDTILYLDGNYAELRRHKKHNTTPEHVRFRIETREDWEELAKPFLTPDPSRINFEAYRNMREHCRKNNRFFALSGLHVFELMRAMLGDLTLLYACADDPEWIQDMVMTYAKLINDLHEIIFEKEGKPDGIWFYEDMGYKGSTFISPAMYRELIMPAHKLAGDFAHAHNFPLIVHSCGYVEPLLPDMIAAGMDMLQVIEVKAGMDLLRIHKNYGEKLGLMGGIDIRTLLTNDLSAVDRELESKIPFVKEGFGYVLHSDHSIPDGVDISTYRYFIEKGLELGKY